MNDIKATFTNAAEGLESYVTETANGFMVTLKDLNADAVLPTAIFRPTFEAAETYAKLCAEVE